MTRNNFIEINKSRKGKTYEEIYGKEKAEKFKAKLRKLNSKRLRETGLEQKGKSLEEIHGKEIAEKIKKANRNENNHMWKGKEVKSRALHEWVRKRKPKPDFCEACKENPPIDLANISGKYKRDIRDYEWLCRKCHITEDGRLNKLITLNSKRSRDKLGRFEKSNRG